MTTIESLMLAKVVQSSPGSRKEEVISVALDHFSADWSNASVYSKYIDNMIGAGQMVKMDTGLFLTPSGLEQLSTETLRMMPALKALVYS